MNDKQKRFLLVDILLTVMIIAPLVAAMLLKILTAPATEGISISGARIFFTIPMPLQDLPITEAQINSWLVMISILGVCLLLTHGLSEDRRGFRQMAAEWIVEKLDGLVSGNIDLTKPITRLQIAQLAAKAMKLNVTNLPSAKPFTDTADVYVQALNAAGIIEGYFSNGSYAYRPSNTLTRGQLSAIVWRMRNY